MNQQEAAALLGVAASFDNRKPDPDAATAWAIALGDLRFIDCRDAIVAHYQSTTEWMMPFHVITGVKSIRTKRLGDFGIIPDPTHLDTDAEDFNAQYQHYISSTMRRIADGDLVPGETPPAESLPARDVASLGLLGRTVPARD